MDSAAQTGHGNGSDWQEEVYQKIKRMGDLYLPELNDMYERIATKLQQCDLPQGPKTEQVDKLRMFKTMLERAITFLRVSKENVQVGFKDKLTSYERQIINFINTNKLRKKIPPMQPGQLQSSQMNPQGSVEPAQQQQNTMLQPNSNMDSGLQVPTGSLQQNSSNDASGPQ